MTDDLTYSERLAAFALAFRLDTEPDAFGFFRTALIDTLGVMLCGSTEPPAVMAREMVLAEAARPQGPIVGTDARSSWQLAALANGVAAHAMDYDFSFVIGQAAAPVLPALLAIAESEAVDCAELAAAFIVGCETAARLALAVPKISSGAGWQAAGTVGTVAATVAVGRLLRLAAPVITDAIGIAASSAAGLGVNYGTMTKPLHVGQAARNAVAAVVLARRGFTAARASLEGRAGFMALFAPPNPRAGEAFDGLGEALEALQRGLTLKLYPCGGRLHTAIEAALALRDSVVPERIATIRVNVTPPAAKRALAAYPESIEAAKFSAGYVVAYALTHGAPMLPAFTESAIADPAVRALAGRVAAEADPTLGDGSKLNPARVAIETVDGGTIEILCREPSGSREKPLSPEQMRVKFTTCASHAIGEAQAARLFTFLSALEPNSSLSELWPLLRPA